MKKSILFIADKPNWAYHNLIKTWAKGLEDFDCYIAFAQDYSINVKSFNFPEKLLINSINSIRSADKKFLIDSSKKFSYPVYKQAPVYEVNSDKKVDKVNFDIIFECAYYFQYTAAFPFVTEKRYVGLYTDSYPHEGPSFDYKTGTDLTKLQRIEFFEKYLKKYDGVIAGSSNLQYDYEKLTEKIIFANGIFRQNEFAENESVGRKDGLTIGWTGTPDRPMKGFRNIIEPAVEKVQKTGRKIKLKTQFSGSYESLLRFYEDVDLVLIASEADTGPSLFSEAALSSVPAVSTRIGFPKMVIKDGKNGIFAERDVESFKTAIIKLYDDRELLKLFSKKIKEDYLTVLDNNISIENLKKLFK